ncbi:hypothetical protein E6H23_08195 [Candidatus Bathyarchaeota archaeon]|nr:MAG: hypothetical protein E6H23_08195 [Candidatus Bathyarchaeota archaeon]
MKKNHVFFSTTVGLKASNMSGKKNLKSQRAETVSGSRPGKSSSRLERVAIPETSKSRQSGKSRRARPPEKIRAASKIVISVSLLILLTLGFTSVLAGLELQHPFASSQSQSQTLLAHRLISIQGDSGFTADQGVTGGTGTTSDPYIIQGWSIDLSPYQTVSFPPRAGISIERTTAQFVIRNVKVSGGLSALASIGVTTPCYFSKNGIPGIMLSHVQNGIVQNSESDQNSVGVYLDHSTSNSITNNVLQGNECGVYLLVSNYNTISFNAATGLCCNPLTWENGFSFHLFGSSNNTISYNKAYNAAIGFTVSAIRTTNIIDFRATGNTLANNTASYSQNDGFFLNETDHNILESNTAENTIGAYGADGVGFNFEYTIGEVVMGNSAIDNRWGGFLLQASTENLLISNTATGGTIPGIPAYGAGFSFLKADLNTLISNVAYINQKGFDLTTSSFHNRFTRNIAHDNGIGFVMEIGSDVNVFDFNQVYRNTEGFSVDTASAGNGGSGETFAYNTVRDNAQGFSVGTSENQTILGNLVFDNNVPFAIDGVIIMDSTGISLQGVIKSKISSNIVINNPVGIETGAGILQGGGNSIYNNFLSNPENANVDPTVPDNWNVAERPGTNVIGGPSIGGNFWSDYTGTDTNNDGIGDSAYYPQTCVSGLCSRWGQTTGINVDHLPLVFAPSSGTTPDFTLVTPPSFTVDQASNGTFVLALVSRNAFSGTITLSATTSPSMANGPQIGLNPSTINLAAGGTMASAVNVTSTFVPGTYNVDIKATTPTTSHTKTLQLTIAAVSHPSPTITTVVCTPPTVALNHATSCTATVADINLAASTSPTGTVTFTPGGNCTLNGTGPSSSCSVSITPSTSGTIQISATYLGSATDAMSTGGTIITVTIRTSITTVTCTPATVIVNQASTCTATVTDTSQGTTSTPTSTVTWTTTNSGTFSAMTCTLAGTYASASCYVTYTPATTGSHKITGSYGGDTTHPMSSGNFPISVGARTTTTAVACTPSIPVIGQATSCTATVADNAPGTISTPTGTVTFSVTGGWRASAVPQR